MDSAKKVKIERRLRQYAHAYLQGLRQTIARYPSVRFPDFIVGHRHVLSVLGSDGVLLVYYPNSYDSFDFSIVDGSVQNVLGRLSEGMLSLNLGREFGLEIADPKILEGDQNGPVVWQAPWSLAELSSKTTASRWSMELAASTSMNLVLTFVTAHLMGIQDAAADKDKVFTALETIIARFEELLDRSPLEEDIQQYLTDNPVLLSPTASRVSAKVKLGSEFVTDFVVEMADQHYTLVEIERSIHPLFNQNGDPSAKMTHAQRQVEDWRQWVHENIAYARNVLPGVTNPEAWVILGRKCDMTERDRTSLGRKNAELHSITILTYDDLIDAAKQHLSNLRNLSK